MILYIDWDERYPDYSLAEAQDAYYNTPVEVDDLLYQRWKAARREYNAVQYILKDLLNSIKEKS